MKVTGMTLGELRKDVECPKLAGVIPIVRLHDNRDVVIQIPTDKEDVYEYRTLRATGVLFLDGAFVNVLAAGDVI